VIRDQAAGTPRRFPVDQGEGGTPLRVADRFSKFSTSGNIGTGGPDARPRRTDFTLTNL
jgi:hypothetical protein